VRLSESEASNHTSFLADFITATPAFKLSVHTGGGLKLVTDEASRSAVREGQRSATVMT
jgi:hypothetical protein